MRKVFLFISFLTLAIFSLSLRAEALAKDAIPSKITDHIYKKYPNAIDISAQHKQHFGQELYEIQFKNGEEQLINYYRANGQYYVEGVKIDTSETTNMLPPTGNDNLKSAFPKYDITEAILIVNPNGAGEEYDLIVSTDGQKWRISMDKNGALVVKERN
jgi:hypothetical protein